MAAILHTLDQRRLIDSNGIADGSSIYFYVTGTDTPAPVYTDAELTTEYPSPIVVNAGAPVPDIYLDSTITYRRRIVYSDGSVDDTDPWEGGVVRGSDLGSTDTGKGADLVSLTLPFVGAVPTTVEARVRAGAFNAGEAGMNALASAATNAEAFQKSVDYARTENILLEIPGGGIDIDSNVTLAPMTASAGDRIFTMKGQGPGENGTFLHFTTGSLVMEDYHQLSDFRITSDAGDGIVIQPNAGPPVRYPVRSSMQNVWAMGCGGSGITFADCWEYLILNCYARFNNKWGIEGKLGPNFSMSCNALTIIGGQFQNNGTRQGTLIGGLGGSLRGTGGGIYLGNKCVQVLLIGAAIEGNRGDGLKLGQECRGVTVYNVYFEKNGSHHTNVDICCDAPSAPALSNSGLLVIGSNFTPQDNNGTMQERAIDLYDVKSFRAINPVFFSASGMGYTQPPIRVRETENGRATGWIEGNFFNWSGYDQLLVNETHRFGYPMKHRFTPDFVMPDAADTTSQRFYVPVPRHGGRRVDVAHFTRPGAGYSTSQSARLTTNIMRGPSGTLFSAPTNLVQYGSSNAAAAARNFSSSTSLPSTDTAQGSAEVTIQRTGTHVDDTLTADVTLLGVEITTYEGVVGV